MTRPRFTTSGPPMMELNFTVPELPLPEITGHDEWLLDEALAETFPASDPIAVSPWSPGSDKPV